MPSCTLYQSPESYADFIFRHNSFGLDRLIELYGTDCISLVDDEYAIVHYPLSEIGATSPARQSYLSIPFLYGLLDTGSMAESGILETFQQPALSYQGDGVLIGLIDTGIDYQNPLFLETNQTTRILGIWDQTTDGSGFTLTGNRSISFPFLYGTEYRAEQINDALRSDNPLSVVPTTDSNGHGTFLAGIAAGGALADGSFIGAAPRASLGIVRLRPAKTYLRDYYLIQDDIPAYQSNDIMMGITYLRLLALRHRMPLVLCLGLGSNQGGHNGASPLDETLNHLQSFSGITSVCAAGNEAGRRHHYIGQTIADLNASDAIYDEVELRVGERERGFCMELWADSPEIFTIGFVSPTGEVIQRIPYRQSQETTITFALEQTTITLSYAATIGPQNSFLASMRVQNPAPGIWRIRVYPTVTISGFFHLWLPLDGFISENTYFLLPNPFTTITSPGNAAAPITVSTYDHENDSLYIHSSRGYTRDGRIKPDLAAPGVNVYGPGISSVRMDFPITRKTGSSVAAAHTAGAAANLYSWGYVHGNVPNLTSTAVKAYLLRGADRTAPYSYPNQEWGYGTLDLYQAFLSVRN